VSRPSWVQCVEIDSVQDEEMQDTAEQHVQPSQASEPVDSSMSQPASSPEPSAITTQGRRRGRRKIMKKKTIKDEEGYLGKCSLIFYIGMDSMRINDFNS